MPKLIAGWMMAFNLLWMCWALGAPVVADAARQPARYEAICPYIVVTHGVGSDLRTWVKERDLCASNTAG